MARLTRGQNAKIDHINDLVLVAIKQLDTYTDSKGITYDEQSAMAELLNMFKPMILKICSKWANYFDDKNHTLKSFDELLTDVNYWFIFYTKRQYIVDGEATYNKFIHDHINFRVRYIFESEIAYHKHLVFPDPDKNDEYDDSDQLNSVISRYSDKCDGTDFVSDIEDEESATYRKLLADKIVDIVDKCPSLNSRDRTIFKEVLCNGTYHCDIGARYNISRTRVVQILRRIKKQLYNAMENDQEVWDLINKSGININKWGE